MPALETSSEASLSEQSKFRKLAASVRALGETVEHQVSAFANSSEVLRGFGEAAPCPPSHSSGASTLSSEPVVRERMDTVPMFPEV